MGYNTNIFLLELFMRHQQTDCREQRQRSFPWPSLLGMSENKLHKDGEILCLYTQVSTLADFRQGQTCH